VSRILVVAGEPSGETHAARAVSALRERVSGIQVEAVGGDQLHAAGADVRWRADRLSARGLTEAIASLPAHWRLRGELRRELAQGRFDAVLLVDYPGFNLSVARVARTAGVPVLYYIAPQLWAWGGWRISRLRRDVARLATILPFESEFFSEQGIDTTFVGHPLLDVPRPDRASARRTLGFPVDATVLGLFPGSREPEIARHWDLFRHVWHRLRANRPELRAVVAARAGIEYPDADGVTLHQGDAAVAFAAADAALCKSGTTTLEAALADTPMVIAYKMGAATYAAARHLVQIPRIGLVNIVAGRQVAPEFVQRAATLDALAGALEPLLQRDGVAARAQRAALSVVRERLGAPGAAGRVADLMLGMVA
jgi:lipid-A-disaccharide synthase